MNACLHHAALALAAGHDGDHSEHVRICRQWASIAAALVLDQTQHEQLIQLRRMYLRVLGKAVRRRRQQLQLLHVSAAQPCS